MNSYMNSGVPRFQMSATAGQLETTEQWTAGPIESEDEDADRRAAIQNTEPVEEDADVSEHVVTVPLTLREARGRALQLQ